MKQKWTLLVSSFILLICFWVARLPLLSDYALINFEGDALGYVMLAEELLSGQLPDFDDRTPGYPIFIAFVKIFSDTYRSIVYAQILYSLVALLALVYVIDRYLSPYLALLSAIVLGLYASGPTLIDTETSILTDSTFTSSLIVGFALFIKALYDNKLSSWISYSVMMAIAILIRPAGLFLIVSLLFVTIYLLFTKAGLKTVLAASVPFVSILLLLILYNVTVTGFVGLTAFGQANFAGTTITFMETSDQHPKEINEIIEKNKAQIPPVYTQFIQSSSDLDTLYICFAQPYNNVHRLRHDLLEYMKEKKGEEATFLDTKDVLEKITKDAISQHSDYYMKFFKSNFYYYFFKKIAIFQDFDFFINHRMVACINYLNNPESTKEYTAKSVRKLKVKMVQSPDGQFRPVIKETSNYKNAKNLIGVYLTFFGNPNPIYAWGILLWLSMLGSFVLLISSRLQNKLAFFVFILTTAAIGHGLIVSLSEVALVRYSYVLEFANYLGTILVIYMLIQRFYPQIFTSKSSDEKSEDKDIKKQAVVQQPKQPAKQNKKKPSRKKKRKG